MDRQVVLDQGLLFARLNAGVDSSYLSWNGW